MNDRNRILIAKAKQTVIVTKHERKVSRLLNELNIYHHRQYHFEYNNSFILVDLLIPKTKTVIEVDGKHHYRGQKLIDDAKRDMYLKSIGFRVIRIENDEVRNMDAAKLFELIK
jgi:very-short-patch-repair endonuclease